MYIGYISSKSDYTYYHQPNAQNTRNYIIYKYSLL